MAKTEPKENGNIVTKLKKSYDAVIVGAGPAGASAAKVLYGSGLNVLIIEKCSLPIVC